MYCFTSGSKTSMTKLDMLEEQEDKNPTQRLEWLYHLNKEQM